MVELRPHDVDHKNNDQPILFNREIDEYAHDVLADYDPRLLREPGTVNWQHFLESYLGMRIIFQDLYSEDPDRQLLAVTAFKKGKIKVFDRESESIRKIIVPARSVIVNNSIMKNGREQIALFSGMHEAGHIMMQWHVYTGETFGGEPYVPNYGFERIEPMVCCRQENIESKVYARKERTAEEWREHHADYFAGAITMPNRTFIPFVRNLMREQGIYRDAITLGINDDLDILAEDIIPYEIKAVYGVSKRAAQIKLRTCGLVRNRSWI